MTINSILESLSYWDEKCSKRLSISQENGFTHHLAGFLAHSGDSWFWGLGLIAVLYLGAYEWKFLALWMLIGAMISAVIVFVIKQSVRRSRPAGDWGQIYRKTDPHSFPSGHASRAVLFAVLAFGLGPIWFAFVLLLWAPCVMLARVAMGVHYLSDVLAGAIIGAGIGGGLFWIIPQISFPFLNL